MKVISPVSITDSMLTFSTVSEPAAGETAWVSAGTYALGDFRIRVGNHRTYFCVQAHTGRTALPENDAAYWQDYGPTMKWAMFDGVVNTQSSGTSALTVKVVPGIAANSAGFFELVGTTLTVVQKDSPGGTTVKTNVVSLDGTIITDWYTYFFEPFVQKTTVVMTDLLPYSASEITATVSGSGTVKCGVMTVGTAYELGTAQYGATASITDYSIKTTDAYGTVKLAKRAFSKKLDAKLWMDKSIVNQVHALLSTLRATPAVWIGSDETSYANPLVVFGYYKDFSMEIAYPTVTMCSLQVEGLI